MTSGGVGKAALLTLFRTLSKKTELSWYVDDIWSTCKQGVTAKQSRKNRLLRTGEAARTPRGPSPRGLGPRRLPDRLEINYLITFLDIFNGHTPTTL